MSLKNKWTTIISRQTRPFTSQSQSQSQSQPTTSISQSRPQSQGTTKSQPRPKLPPSIPSSSSFVVTTDNNVSSHNKEHKRLNTSTSSQSTISSSSPSTTSDPDFDSLDMIKLSESVGAGARMISDEIPQTASGLISSLVSSAYGPEGVLTPSAVEGGKRFLGQLVKTVSAAAAGNVPNHEAPEGQGIEEEG